MYSTTCVQDKYLVPSRLETRLFINLLDYDTKTKKSLISFSFRNANSGLVDSAKFVINKIASFERIQLNHESFYFKKSLMSC